MSNITLDQLCAVVNPNAFDVITPIFTSIAQHLKQSEGRVAELEHEHISLEQISTTFRDALAHLTHTALSPPPPLVQPQPVQPQVQVARAPLRTELPLFHGCPEENVSAFISIAKDLLQATHIAQEDWGVIVSGCFHDAAQTWYLTKKQGNADQPLQWNELQQGL
ncbi:hypothetical protein GYMLUDRAFT_62550 [Collybiopsis luxurians FD-317 M1]|uniref:Retrotransposon gag domain-containing protein n=1 Tax=Collybiopsis luxurians FD-317 M1 TaxID=944289 RepID=A0A0D0CBK2_9AGAR|nr:hypothetical protein GYMLUDRAFT_62550 [Collybiopsis luxurians FD-317 M1]